MSKKIALVVGHRSSSRGAYGNVGISEFYFNKEFVMELMEILKRENFGHTYKVFYRSDAGSGYTDRMIDLHSRIDQWGADISIEFHFNAAGNLSVDGHEVLYCSKKGELLAKNLEYIFTKTLGTTNRGVKKRTMSERGGGFLCRGKSVCLISEPFFAAHQNRFVVGGDLRDALIKSYVDFFALLM